MATVTIRYRYYNSRTDNKFSPEYRAWLNMKSRCYTTSSNQYEDYGGRGISVVTEWRNSFETFLQDVGNRPSPAHTLDRKNVNKDYSPDNCRWAKYGLQNHNQRLRSGNKSGYRGVCLSKRSGKYVANIWQDYVMQGLGLHTDLEQAALAYDAAAVQIYGHDAQLNILEQ